MPYMLYTQRQHSFALHLEGVPEVKGGIELLMVVDFALKTRRGGGAGSAVDRYVVCSMRGRPLDGVSHVKVAHVSSERAVQGRFRSSEK